MKKTIMVVDDMGSDTVEMILHLKKLQDNFIVLEYTNPTEALVALNETRPDIIVLDFQMPEMNGLEFLDAFNTQGFSAPVVMYSSEERPEVLRQEALKRGACCFVRKGSATVKEDLVEAILKATATASHLE